jgi:glycosyltransferase involved in cell wall biosynthesis
MKAALSGGVSVIMPTYNGAAYIHAALTSLCRRNDQPDEVIVVDDGSEDDTLEIASTFASRLPLTILEPPRQGNWLAMTNRGLAQASCAWSAILHQDDVWLEGRLSKIQPFLDGPADLLLMDTRFLDAAGRVAGSWRLPRTARGTAGSTPRLAASLYVQNWVAVPSATFRTEVAVNSGGLDESLWYTADWDLWLRLCHESSARYVPGFGSGFRVHDSSLTVTGSADLGAFREQMAEVQRRHRWATLASRRPSRTIRAGHLSTETNVLLASLLHQHTRDVRAWQDAAWRARPTGIVTYAANSTIASRVFVRAALAARARGFRPGMTAKTPAAS